MKKMQSWRRLALWTVGFLLACSVTLPCHADNGMVADSIITQFPPPMPGNGERPPMPPGGPGGMRGPGGMGGPGGRPEDMLANIDLDATDPGAYKHTSGEASVTEQSYSSSTSDVNAVRVSDGIFQMSNCTITKNGGDTQSHDGSSFFGINTAVLATGKGVVEMNGGTITTNAIGANAIVAYGGTVKASDVTINCSNRLSRGVHATGGGTIIASNLNIVTQSPNSSVIALDRGGGTVEVTGGSYVTSGTDSAILYSTGNLTVNGITGTSEKGEVGVIEGDNFITILNSDLVSGADENSRGLMILQSGSGDAGTGLNGVISVTGGSLTMTKEKTPLIEIVTNVTGKVTLDGVKTQIPSGILMEVDYNKRWHTKGATGILVLEGNGSEYAGDVVTDSFSSAEVTIGKGVAWNGAFDADNTGRSTSLVVNGGVWSLTRDSYVDSITLTGNAVINKNGYMLDCPSLTQTSGSINE